MEWTKLPTDLLVQRIPDNELISIIKYQSLWALFERKPEDKEALRYMTIKQLSMASQWLNTIEAQVKRDIIQCNNKRGREKTKYLKNRDKSEILPAEHREDCQQTVYSPSPQIRLDKIREDNKENQLENQDTNQLVDKDKEYLKEFEIFWNLYPKQRAGSKKKAFTAYQQAIKEKRCTHDTLMQVVKYYAQSDEVKKGYAKGCQAWLNDDRFNNDYGQPKVIEKKPIPEPQWDY